MGIAIIGACVTVLALLVAWLEHRRANRSGKIQDKLNTVELWREENAALEKRLGTVEAENADLRRQVEVLTEIVTKAAAVEHLATTIEKHHRVVLQKLDALGGSSGGR